VIEKRILRFTAGERVFHWVYFITFLVLALTGAFLYVPWRSFSMGEAGQMTRFVHRLFALGFLASPLLPLIFSPRRYLRNLGEAFTWRAEDLRGLRVMLTRYYWTGDSAGLPPQGKFTAGQKMNIVMQVSTFCILAATGLILWFGRGILPVGAMQWSLVLHGLSAVIATCFVLIHIYMVTLHPLTSEAIAAIFSGTVSEDYARDHHPDWHASLERDRSGRL
jgi:formate dehydrogenase subunit gamma